MLLEGNMEISSNFNQLSFHDATIESVHRDFGSIEINFDFVVVGPDHSEANGKTIELK